MWYAVDIARSCIGHQGLGVAPKFSSPILADSMLQLYVSHGTHCARLLFTNVDCCSHLLLVVAFAGGVHRAADLQHIRVLCVRDGSEQPQLEGCGVGPGAPAYDID